jgi:predicted branched-subunit amino acid permease
MATKSSKLFRGAKDILPHHLGVFPFGLVFGVLAIASGLSPLEAILMSSIVFGGASQIVFVQLWSAGVPPFIVGTSVSIVNLRHVLYSASLSQYIKNLPLIWRLVLAYFLTDQTYANGLNHYRSNQLSKYDHYYFLGSGLALWSGWQIATIFGVLGATIIPSEWSLTFAISLTFIAIVAPMIKRFSDVAACITTGILAIILQPLPWKLWLIAAGFGGILIGWFVNYLMKEGKNK